MITLNAHKIFHRNIFLLLLFFILPFCKLYSQNVEFEKENFKDRKDEFKAAVANIKKGDSYMQAGMAYYKEALANYLQAYSFNKNNAFLNFKIGACYIYSSQKDEALTYLLSAQKLQPDVVPDIHYNLGRAYQLSARWDEAISEYNIYKNRLPADQLQTEGTDISKKIEECNNGKEFSAKPVHIKIENIGPANSPAGDYAPVISADESTMMFTSVREGTTGGEKSKDDGDYFEDIYVCTQEKGVWSAAKNIGASINTKGNDAAIGLSADGQKLLVYKGENGGDIYISNLKGSDWTKPENFSKNVNTEYHESSASFAPDGRTLYFVSDRPGGSGGRDIYKTNLDVKGKKWLEPVNLGGVINTSYDEEGAYMHPDGKTLYFSSQGHKSMGGYDVFKSVWNDSTKQWSEPENLGYPVNTPDDDVFMVLSGNGQHGYYASIRSQGAGEKDIYRMTFLSDKPLVLNTEDNLLASQAAPVSEVQMEPAVEKTNQLTLVKGIVRDKLSQQPLEASIEITDNQKNEIVGSFTSNSATGKYLISLPSGKNYGIAVKADGYLFHSENFDIPASKNYQEIEKNIDLEKIAVGNKIILKNIFFDFDKATLRSESTAELERLTGMMNDIPTLRIEISGHTDNIGTAEYNQKLSENRAKAVVDYLVKHSIAQSRLEFAGYGFSQPIVPNTSEENRQMNRRTEFKVLSK